MAEYVLARGSSGQRRLEILNDAMWPSSRKLLRQAGLRKGKTFLDVGCGPGALTKRVFDLGIEATGVDIDPGFIESAQQTHKGPTYACASVFELASLDRQFDVVYARYLLSHLADPAQGIQAMIGVIKPGGKLVLEDVDFDLHVAEPRPPAFDRYLQLYEAVVKLKGGDPFLGRKLFKLATQADLTQIKTSVQVSVFTEGAPKRMSSLTLEGSRATLLASGLATETELDQLIEELMRLESTDDSVISIAGTFQVIGKAQLPAPS